MGKTFKLIFWTVFLLLGLALLNVRLSGQEILSSRNFEVEGANLVSTILQPECDLVAKIQTAKEILQLSPPLKMEERSERKKQGKSKYVTVQVLVRREVSLAILDTQTCDVFEKRYLLDEDEIKTANSIRRGYLDNPGDIPKFRPVDIQNDFRVDVNWWNNHNSDLSIVKEGNTQNIERGDLIEKKEETGRFLVIGNKFSISNDSLAYLEDRTGNKYSDIVYIPYSRGIHIPELIESGRKFLIENAEMAFKDLEALGVQSHSYPDSLVTEAIAITFVKNLFLTEQTDPALVFASSDNGQRLAERVLVRLGANEHKTFRYTYSKTGALGLGQIMPGTYGSIVKRYPEAKLIKDIDIGRVDIVNGIKATALVLDDHFGTVVSNANKTKKGQLILNAKTPEQIQEIMAAAYNGGPGKYKPLTGNISLAVRETVDFVRKFKMLRDLKLFD
ncbi:MAG: lytic transglycosylase domain-containing protein [bacterium]|nr:lytic transglycosylase domain-containing protein [bacterium]